MDNPRGTASGYFVSGHHKSERYFPDRLRVQFRNIQVAASQARRSNQRVKQHRPNIEVAFSYQIYSWIFMKLNNINMNQRWIIDSIDQLADIDR